MSISLRPFSSSATVDVASSAISHARSDLLAKTQSNCVRLYDLKPEVTSHDEPFLDELRSDAALDDLEHLVLVGDVNLDADVVAQNLDAVLERLAVGADDDGRVHLLLEPRARLTHHLTR